MKGFHNKVMQVNLKQRSSEEQFVDNEIYARLLGGKGLTTHLLLNNTKAGIDPLVRRQRNYFCHWGLK